MGARVPRAPWQIRSQILYPCRQVPPLQDRHYPRLLLRRMGSGSSIQILSRPLEAALHSHLSAAQGPTLHRSPAAQPPRALARPTVPAMIVRCPLGTQAVAAKASPAPSALWPVPSAPWPAPLTPERTAAPLETPVMRAMQAGKETKQAARIRAAPLGLALDQARGAAAPEAIRITVVR